MRAVSRLGVRRARENSSHEIQAHVSGECQKARQCQHTHSQILNLFPNEAPEYPTPPLALITINTLSLTIRHTAAGPSRNERRALFTTRRTDGRTLCREKKGRNGRETLPTSSCSHCSSAGGVCLLSLSPGQRGARCVGGSASPGVMGVTSLRPIGSFTLSAAWHWQGGGSLRSLGSPLNVPLQ